LATLPDTEAAGAAAAGRSGGDVVGCGAGGGEVA
jgi:hypothetical protein